MTRLRLFAASLIGRIVRPLLRASARLLAGLPEAAPVVPETGTEPVPVKSADELVAAIERFSAERAVDHPAEALFLGLYVTRMAAGLAPHLARITESQPTPPAPDAGPVN